MGEWEEPVTCRWSRPYRLVCQVFHQLLPAILPLVPTYLASSDLMAVFQINLVSSFPLDIFLHLFQKRNSEDKWQRSFYGPDTLPVCHLINSIAALKKTQSTDSNQCPGLVLSDPSQDLWLKGHGCLYAGFWTPCYLWPVIILNGIFLGCRH